MNKNSNIKTFNQFSNETKLNENIFKKIFTKGIKDEDVKNIVSKEFQKYLWVLLDNGPITDIRFESLENKIKFISIEIRNLGKIFIYDYKKDQWYKKDKSNNSKLKDTFNIMGYSKIENNFEVRGEDMYWLSEIAGGINQNTKYKNEQWLKDHNLSTKRMVPTDITPETFKSAYNKLMQLGRYKKASIITKLYFKEFIGKKLKINSTEPLPITHIRSQSKNYKADNDYIIIISIGYYPLRYYISKDIWVASDERETNEWDITNTPMSRQSAFILCQIAKKINPNTKYNNVYIFRRLEGINEDSSVKIKKITQK